MDKYVGDHYGAMLYNLYDNSSTRMLFRCWGTAVKLTWDCPRSTHRYFVNNFLAPGFVPIRTKVISRYVKFFCSLLNSSSKEVRLIASISAQDKSSTTGINVAKIANETGLNPWTTTPAAIRQALLEREDDVPERDQWRLPYLEKLLNTRYEMELSLQDTKPINKQIDLLCIS